MLFRVIGSDTPVATTPPIDSFSSLTWSRVPDDEAVFGGEGGQWISSVTPGGPGLVAVGADGTPDNDAAVWTSPDGVTWSRVPHDESIFGGEHGQTMSSVIAGGPGLVAVGSDGQGILDFEDDLDAAVWTSVDGYTWSRVPHDAEVFGGALIMSVTVGGPGLVAVGGTGGFNTDGDAVVWTSVDGISWSRVPHDESIFGGVERQAMSAVTVGDPGLVAVGTDGGIGPWDHNTGTHAAVWTSVDGITWSRVPNDEALLGTGGNPAPMLGVTAGGPGLVAVGSDWWTPDLARTPVWTSPDGFTWIRVPDDETVRGVMLDVIVAGPGLVAVGSAVVDADLRVVWSSVDGITWRPVPDDDAIFAGVDVSSVIIYGPYLIAVGSADDNDAAVWVAVAGE